VSSAALKTTDVGYDLILLWGQSNMSGRGVPYDTTRYDPSDPRVAQYGASGTYAGVLSQAVEPLAMHDTPSGIGPGSVFARWYLQSVPVNRRVLLVPSAHGGVPLSSNVTLAWRRGVAGNLYAQAVAQAQAALAAAGANARYTAILWVQGETDGDNGTSGAAYQTDLDALIAGARADLGVPDLPFVLGQMVPEYLSTGTRAAINSVHLGTPSRNTRVRVAPGVYGNNIGDGNHYSAPGQRILGRSMFDAYQRVLTGAADPTPPAVPGQVTGLAASNVTTTGLTLTWTATAGAGAYNVQQKTTAGSTFVSIATTTAPTVAVSGLTTGTSYDFRVIAVSTGGPGTVSAIASATPGGVNNGLGQTIVTARAYSLRLVVPTYAGSAVKVRRSSDSTTQDIGFVSGALDTASLLTFCGSGDGFIDTWYDQSGNTRNLTQATTTAQPKLVSAGAVLTSGGKPAVTFDGVDDVVFQSAANLQAAGAASMCAVLSAATPTVQLRWWAESVSTNTVYQYGLSEPDNNNSGGHSRARPVLSPVDSTLTYQGNLSTFNGAIHQMSATDSGTAMAQWLDGAVDLASVAYTRGTGEPTRDRFAIGGVVRSGSLAPLPMTFSEAVFWTSVLGTSDRQAAEANQKGFYATP
jgi:hypothetical protein